MFRSFIVCAALISSNFAYAEIKNNVSNWYFLINMSQPDPSVSLVSSDYEAVRKNWVKGNEIIAVHESLLTGADFEPKFDKLGSSETKNTYGETNCAYGLDALNKISNKYRLCTSTFIREKPASSIIQNTVGALFTLGTSIGHTVVYDPIKFYSLLESDAVSASIVQTIYKSNVEFVRNQPTARSYQLFIDKYKSANYDPDMLVSKLSLELPNIQAREAAAAQAQRILEKNAAIAEQDRQNAKAAEQAQVLSKFRKTVKIGDNTNCGLVVSVQDSIVQVQTSSDLRWMKRDQILPTGYGGYCN